MFSSFNLRASSSSLVRFLVEFLDSFERLLEFVALFDATKSKSAFVKSKYIKIEIFIFAFWSEFLKETNKK
jgi:hypothetical protein